ncbi:MAG: methylenetetrahydrofolate reductase [NAD(P)H] [Syntrophomonadaceae bacterium]|jgi:methylenetetrahydrofolate reductase (NADPH)|nr:methylenetetrahydrofolate reductase [NAD(P)H] [Syntrophomonadaceae bacterium]
MKIIEFYRSSQPVLSLEIFPPSMIYPIETVFYTLDELVKLNAHYISITYPGGYNRARTVGIAARIKQQYGIEAQAHLTCVNHTSQELENILAELQNKDVTNIMALRGDLPETPDFDIKNCTYHYANELIEVIKAQGDFGIAAAAHPEGHPDCRRLKEDLYHLKNKVETGADFLITQLFFDNRIYFDFIDKCLSININCPIVPGIMPVLNANQIKKMIYLNGGSMPAKLIKIVDKYGDNPADMEKAGIDYAAGQISDLVADKVAGIHMYTMNKARQITNILEQAGLA